MSNLCVLGAAIMAGPQLDGTFRFHAKGQELGQMCVLGTFSEYTVVPMASVDQGRSCHRAGQRGTGRCGVTTGYGSAVRTGETRDGDTVVVMGVGGIGINAVQGARIAGARNDRRARSRRVQAHPLVGVRRHPRRCDRRRRRRRWSPT